MKRGWNVTAPGTREWEVLREQTRYVLRSTPPKGVDVTLKIGVAREQKVTGSGGDPVADRASAQDFFVKELPLAALAQPVLAPGAPALFAFEHFAEGSDHGVVAITPVKVRQIL